MIKAIIFDLGNTYCEGSLTDFLKRASKVLNRDLLMEDDGIVFDEDYNKGKISLDTCFKKVFGNELTDEQIKGLTFEWKHTWRPTDEWLKLIEILKNKYKLAILSNSDPVNSKKYWKEGWYDNFNEVILSHELGIMKPDQRIYDIALKKLALKANECIFVDDVEKCLVPARKMGMKTIHYKNFKQLLEEFAKNNIQIN